MKFFLCIICKEQSKIKINVLNYCDACFIKQFENKIYKNIRNLPYQSKILIFVKNKYDLILLNVLNKMKNKKNYFFEIFSTFTFNNLKIEDVTSVLKINKNHNINEYIFKMETKRILACDDLNCLDLINIAIEKSLNVIMYTKTIEEICNDVFKNVLDGKPLNDINVKKINISENVLFINMFDGIRNKEIQYYMYLYKELLNISNGIIKNDKTDKKQRAIDNFIFEIDKNNTLAFFNIINTIRKL